MVQICKAQDKLTLNWIFKSKLIFALLLTKINKMYMFNVRPGKGHLAAEALITDPGGPSLVNKSNYENKPTQLSPAKDGPVCRRHLLNE